MMMVAAIAADATPRSPAPSSASMCWRGFAYKSVCSAMIWHIIAQITRQKPKARAKCLMLSDDWFSVVMVVGLVGPKLLVQGTLSVQAELLALGQYTLYAHYLYLSIHEIRLVLC